MRTIVFFMLCLGSLTLAQPATQPTTRPARGDTVQCSGIVNAPASEIFAAFRTPEGIVKAWSVAKAKVDFRVGGQIRTSYKPDIDLDSDKCIVNTILAYEPDRMLAIRPTAPAGSPDWLNAICEAGFNVIRLEEVAPGCTRVTITGMGFGEGPLFDTAWKFFDAGNRETLKKMQEKFDRRAAGEGPDASAKRIMELFRGCTGGVWVADQSMNGRPFRGKTAYEAVLDGQFVTARGAIGDDKLLHDHAVFTVGIDPLFGQAVFRQLMEDGAIAEGFLQLQPDGKTVASPWTFHNAGGESHWYISYEFADTDHMTLRMWKTHEPEGEALITVHYKRLPEAPAGW